MGGRYDDPRLRDAIRGASISLLLLLLVEVLVSSSSSVPSISKQFRRRHRTIDPIMVLGMDGWIGIPKCFLVVSFVRY